MKRLLFLFISAFAGLVLLFYLQSRGANLEYRFFEDPALEAAVKDSLGIPRQALTRNHLISVTELDASRRGIVSLQGIEQLSNLEVLDLAGNRIRSLSPLAALDTLGFLDLSDNGITDLAAVDFNALKDLTNVRVLVLSSNCGAAHPESPDMHQRLEDITLISLLTGLQSLNLADNHLEELSPLGALKSLKRLELQNNRLEADALAPLSDLLELEYLNLRGNSLRDLSPLGGLKKLTYLNLHSNEQIESILPLANLTALQTLILRGVPLRGEQQVLGELRALRRLNIRNSGVGNLRVLADLMAQGALQDRPQESVFAELDIRENPVSREAEENGSPGYGILEPYWSNIALRWPEVLPED